MFTKLSLQISLKKWVWANLYYKYKMLTKLDFKKTDMEEVDFSGLSELVWLSLHALGGYWDS